MSAVLGALVFTMSLNFAFIVMFALAGKEWWYYFKRVRWRKKGVERLIIVDKAGIVRDDFRKLGDDVKVNPDQELIGAYLGKPTHYDAVFGMPCRFVIEGNMTDSDLLKLFDRNAILKKFFEKNPTIKQELEKVIIERKRDGKTIDRPTLLNFVYDANLNAEFSPTKHQDFLSSVGVRLYNLGIIRGLKFLDKVNSMKWLWIGLVIIGVLLIGLLVLVNNTNAAIETLTTAVNNLPTIPAVIN